MSVQIEYRTSATTGKWRPYTRGERYARKFESPQDAQLEIDRLRADDAKHGNRIGYRIRTAK